MNQVQRILESNAPVQSVAGQKYKGRNPQFQQVTDPETGISHFVKVARGIPFVRVS